jgi:RimJ/RimL family protein N-acetyltransferase
MQFHRTPVPNPILLNIPDQLETERLLIRCPRPGDGPIVYASVHDSLASLRQFPASLPWAMQEPALEASEQYCREGQAGYLLRTNLPMLLFLKGTDTHVGNSGLHRFDWSVPKCEIGYWVRAGFEGQGFITEAVKAISAFGFTHLGLRRIEALADEANLASCGVCERAGYALEGTLRHERSGPDGTLRNTRVYAAVS